LLVLGGALASGHQNRVHDAVVLKVLGASRGRLLGAYVLEYLLVGGATAVFGIAAGSAAAALILTQVMNLSFGWLPGPAFGAAAGAIAATVGLGLIGTFAALGQKPAPVLRNL
jgi:putative ABC transport system permease protein